LPQLNWPTGRADFFGPPIAGAGPGPITHATEQASRLNERGLRGRPTIARDRTRSRHCTVGLIDPSGGKPPAVFAANAPSQGSSVRSLDAPNSTSLMHENWSKAGASRASRPPPFVRYLNTI